MTKKHNAMRDTFALSQGGLTTVASFCAMPAISYDRLRMDSDDMVRKCRPLNWRVWLPKRLRIV
jgi:hypothetical protein